jgi:uncharacterized protein (TIGR03083 family)
VVEGTAERSYAPSMAVDYLAHLRADSERFAEVMAGCNPDAPVPTCEGWTAADLVWHLGEVQHSWGTIVHDRLTAWEQYTEPERPGSYDELLDFFRSSSALLVDSLDTTDDDVHVWTWYEPLQMVGFVRRRQAHEAVIHRLDAEVTASTVTDIDAGLATDGVLEAIEWMFGDSPAWATTQQDGPVGRITATDTGASWLVQIGHWSGVGPKSGNAYVDELVLYKLDIGTPSFEVRGAARDLDAWIWNRPTWEPVQLSGDTEELLELVHAGVQ